MFGYSLAAAAAAACAAPALADGFVPCEELQAAHGTYRSAAPERRFGGFGTREVVFADGQWQLIFTHALDPAMTRRTFQDRTRGPFEIGEASDAVDGAYRGVFHHERMHVTLLADDTLGAELTPSRSRCAALGIGDNWDRYLASIEPGPETGKGLFRAAADAA